MIGWVSEPARHDVLLISGRRIDFQILGQEVSLFRQKDSYYLRLPRMLEFTEEAEIEHQKRQTVRNRETGESARICYSMYDQGYDRFRKYEWNNRILTIGSDIEDDFYLQDTQLQPHQIVLEKDCMRVSELGNTGLGELDGQNISFSQFHNGSRLRILNLQLVLHEEFLMVNTVENLYVSLPRFHAREEMLPDILPDLPVFRPYRTADLTLRFETVLADPLPLEERERNPLIFMMGPALTMSSASMMTGMIAAYNGWLNGREWIELLPSILLPLVMVLSTLLWNPMQRVYEKGRDKHKRKQRLKEYETYLGMLEQEIQEFEKGVKERYESIFPVFSMNQESIYRCLPVHCDFLMIRIGSGKTDFDLRLTMNARLLPRDPIRKRINSMKERCAAADLPVVASLKEFGHIGISYEEEMRQELLSWLFQMIAYNGPDVLRLVVLAEAGWIQDHAWIREIPHVRSKSGIRLIASTMNEAAEAGMILHNEDAEAVVLCLKQPLLAALGDVAHKTVTLSKGALPNDTDARIFLRKESSWMESNGIHRFQPDDSSGMDPWVMVKELNRFHLETGQKEHITTPTFYHLYHAVHSSGIPILSYWNTNTVRDGIAAYIGTGDDGDRVILDLHEKGNGPHGLIAGMTGSGKSELIITMLLSLAVNYSPRELQFVMIDFKGGGAAQLFANSSYAVSHVAGVLSNLDITGMERALVSFRNECHRRELLFKTMSDRIGQAVMNLSSYQRMWKQELELPYLPALVIIVDEFAELKKDRPDFMRDLISVARVGRSLGMHMILATQKPSGIVDDQIWSNSRFKICLKVQEKQDSMEMIHAPDASWIRRPGEFFLLCDGILTHGYGGYANASSSIADGSVRCLDAMAHTVKEVRFESQASVTQAAEMIEEILEYGESYQPELLWCPPLGTIHRSDVPEEKKIWIGIADDYYHHAQTPISFDDSAMAVFSIDRSAKASFLKTLMLGLLETSELQDEIFLLDDLSVGDPVYLQERNVIDIFSSQECEKTENLLRHLEGRSGQEKGTVTVILTDVPSFYEAGENNRVRLHSLIEQAEKRKLRLILFLTSASSVSFRDLSLIPFRLALKNTNVQDLSGIFEMPVHRVVSEEGRGLIHQGEILEVSLLETEMEQIQEVIRTMESRYGRNKPYSLPFLPEHVSYDSYEGDGIGLGINISTYSWVEIRKDQKLTVLATYEEELYDFLEVMKKASGNAVMIAEGETVENLDAQILFMREEQYVMSGAKKFSSAVLYIGSGFRDQYRFTSSFKGDFRGNYGVFYEKGKNQVIQYAERFGNSQDMDGVSGDPETVRSDASAFEITE